MTAPKRVLAIQVKMIGDLLLTLPALARIKQRWPEASLEVLTLGAAANLAPCLPWVDRVHRWEKGKLNFATLHDLLRHGKADLSLDFSGTDRAALFAALGKQRIGYEKYAKTRQFRRQVYTQTSKAILKRQHAIQYYLGLLEPLGLAKVEGDIPAETPFLIPDSAQQKAAQLLAEAKIDRPFLVLQPGSARREKFWPAQSWAKLIFQLEKRGYSLVLLGGKNPLEKDHLERIELLSMGSNVVDLTGKLSLPESFAVLKLAAGLIGIDSMLMHVAALLGVPHLALFGPTDPFHWGPWNSNSLVLHAAFPETCLQREQLCFERIPPQTSMKNLSTEQVLQAFAKLEISSSE